MGKYMLKRVLYIVLVFFILSFLLFMIYNMLPVDKAAEFAEAKKVADGEGIEIANYIVGNNFGNAAAEDRLDAEIEKGDTVGSLGTVPCESEQECHLHFEVIKNGSKVNPNKYIKP